MLPEADVLTLMGWDKDGLTAAQIRFAFPRPAQTPQRFHPETGEWEVLAMLYSEAAIAKWQAEFDPTNLLASVR